MDIVEELRADELPGDHQSKREARMELGKLLDRAADEIERLREALREIAFIDGPQLGGIAKRGSLSKIALEALGENMPFEDRWDNA